MKIKHKVVKEFQYLSPDKKIFILKVGTILEEYVYKIKTELIPIDRDIIDNNPEFFEIIDWKAELVSFMRSEKMPQPAQLSKKLIPFFDTMIMSSIQQGNENIDSKEIERKEYDLSLLKRELEKRELELDSKERLLRDKEDDILVRIRRIEKREEEYKIDCNKIEKKEDEVRSKYRELVEKELNLQEKYQELNEKERNFDRQTLISSEELNSKYTELQIKIDKDLKDLSKREKELENYSKEIKEKQKELENRSILDIEIQTKFNDLESEYKNVCNMIQNINSILIERKNKGFVDDPIIIRYINQVINSLNSFN